MKKFVLFLVTIFVFISCESNERNNMLREQRHEIEKQISNLRNICDEKQQLLDSLDMELLQKYLIS